MPLVSADSRKEAAASRSQSNRQMDGACEECSANQVLSVLRIRLFDPFQRPMPGSPFRLSLGGRAIEGKSDHDAWIEIRVAEVPEQAKIEWGKVDEEEEEIPQGPGYPEPSDDFSESKMTAGNPSAPPKKGDSMNYLYEREIHLAFDPEEEEAALQRLHNLGYNVWESLEENVRAFQLTYKRPLTGKLSDIKSELWGWHDDCGPNPFPQLESKHKVA
jgi:hypothetical protein